MFCGPIHRARRLMCTGELYLTYDAGKSVLDAVAIAVCSCIVNFISTLSMAGTIAFSD